MRPPPAGHPRRTTTRAETTRHPRGASRRTPRGNEGLTDMGIRYYKPTSPGRRNASVSDFKELTDKNKKPEKSLTEPLKKKGGRNNQGFITARHRGGGHKRMYRIIDFRRNDRDGQPASVTHIEYDPNRSARIALIVFPDGKKAYILAPDGLKAGMTVTSGPTAEPKVGNCIPLAKIPTGLQ